WVSRFAGGAAPPHYRERGWTWPPRLGAESFISYGAFGDPAQAQPRARLFGTVLKAAQHHQRHRLPVRRLRRPSSAAGRHEQRPAAKDDQDPGQISFIMWRNGTPLGRLQADAANKRITDALGSEAG